MFCAFALSFTGTSGFAQLSPEWERPFASLESGQFGSAPFFSAGSRDGFQIVAFRRKLVPFLVKKGIRQCNPPSGQGFSDGTWFSGTYKGSPEFYLCVTERQQIFSFVEAQISWKEPDKAGDQEARIQEFASELRKLFEGAAG